jgi:hypothetical protein
MDNVIEIAAYRGVTIDLIFSHKKPMFGDLFLICGYAHPSFHSAGEFQFDKLSTLGFSQVDDYFGIRKDDCRVLVWLYPLVGHEEVYHHPGPFTGLRLKYNILRNSADHRSVFLKAVRLFAQHLDVQVFYQLRNVNLGNPPDVMTVENDIKHTIQFWKAKDIETGSKEALKVTY